MYILTAARWGSEEAWDLEWRSQIMHRYIIRHGGVSKWSISSYDSSFRTNLGLERLEDIFNILKLVKQNYLKKHCSFLKAARRGQRHSLKRIAIDRRSVSLTNEFVAYTYAVLEHRRRDDQTIYERQQCRLVILSCRFLQFVDHYSQSITLALPLLRPNIKLIKIWFSFHKHYFLYFFLDWSYLKKKKKHIILNEEYNKENGELQFHSLSIRLILGLI